jgi:hypothetical protein
VLEAAMRLNDRRVAVYQAGLLIEDALLAK